MEIKIDDLTTKDLQGFGVMDNLMTALETRLQREYVKGRIKGPDYAKVYLGSYEATLMQSIQFILGKQQADVQAEHTKEETKHTQAQIRHTEKQTLKLDHDIDLVDVQTEIGKKDVLKRVSETKLLDQDLLLQKEIFRKAVFETALTEVMVTNAQKEGIILDKTALKLDVETLDIKAGTKLKEAELPILVQKLESEKAQTKILQQSYLKLVEETSLIVAQTQTEINKKLLLDQEIKVMQKNIEKTQKEIELLTAQIGKMVHEVNLMKAQVIKMQQEGKLVEAQVKKITAEMPLIAAQIKKMTQEGNLIAAQVTKITKELPLVDAQVKKMAAEATLMGLKGETEKAQTKTPGGGIMKAQYELLNKQKDGFDRDSEQKAAKIFADILTTELVSTDGIKTAGTGFDHSSMATVAGKLKSNI